MTWRQHHERSNTQAWDGEIARGRGDHATAKRCFALAAESEEAALDALDLSKTRTYGITVVSAVALYREAKRYADAKRLAHAHLTSPRLPNSAANQLHELLQLIQTEAGREVPTEPEADRESEHPQPLGRTETGD